MNFVMRRTRPPFFYSQIAGSYSNSREEDVKTNWYVSGGGGGARSSREVNEADFGGSRILYSGRYHESSEIEGVSHSIPNRDYKLAFESLHSKLEVFLLRRIVQGFCRRDNAVIIKIKKRLVKALHAVGVAAVADRVL